MRVTVGFRLMADVNVIVRPVFSAVAVGVRKRIRLVVVFVFVFVHVLVGVGVSVLVSVRGVSVRMLVSMNM
jgi:hypothetical protein